MRTDKYIRLDNKTNSKGVKRYNTGYVIIL